MMKHCDTCGGAIDAAHPFTICPKCLFGEALHAVETPSTVAPMSSPGPAVPRSLHGLSVRTDFFKKYDLVKRLAGGGQGDIWEAWDFEFRRRVAMKRLARRDTATEPVVSRFLAEAQIASQLEHPGILPIFDVGLDPDGRPFYTTQLLPNRNLENVWMQIRDPTQTEWTLRRALELLLHICDVMAYAHGRGVIHRDLKPSNILVGPFGEVRVVDWGSARLLEATSHRLTGGCAPATTDESTGRADSAQSAADGRERRDEETTPALRAAPPAVIGTDRHDAIAGFAGAPQSTASSGLPMTILYTAPEIHRGEADAFGPQTDIYSMGVMLYELLARRPPYSNTDGELPPTPNLRELIRAGPPEPVRSVRSTVSRDLAAICGKAMAWAKRDRYLTMQELAADLRAFLEVKPVTARNPGPLLRLQKLVQRKIYYVFLVTVIAAGAVVAVVVQQNLRTQRDATRMKNAMSNAQLASRSGRWRDALAFWNEAEALPGHDPVELGLRRSEAFIVLSDKTKARAELDALMRRTDLGNRRGAVLLRVGEHEMFSRATFDQGGRHVREALTNGLTAAEAALARGLIADSTPDALSYFQEALKLDPFFHSAHRHSLGLQFVLGRHDELASHLRIAKTLYPGDFSPGDIEVAELAVLGRPAEAVAALAAFRGASPPDTYARMEKGVRFLSKVVEYFDVEVYLGERTNAVSKSELVAEATQLFLSRNIGDATNVSRGPLPQLPCVEQGIGAGFEGVKALALARVLGGASRTDAAIEKIRDSWRHHPEALFPVFAGVFLDNQQPRTGPRDLRLLALQSEMYQMGADSSSVLPNLTRLARVLAVDVQKELALSTHTNATAIRANAVANLRRAAFDPLLTRIECSAYSRWSHDLKEDDLDRLFLARWAQLQPADPSLLRNRIRRETEAGGIGPALKLLDQMLAVDPNDKWALAQRKQVLKKAEELAQALRSRSGEGQK